MLSFRNTEFDYEPYPIGRASEVFEPAVYSRLSESFPPKELFEFKEFLGNKYSLSELNNPDQYHQYVRSTPGWREFHGYIKRKDFIEDILAMLLRHEIDLGVGVDDVAKSRRRRLVERLLRVPRGLSARFEYSMLPADGGCIRPHTDNPQKIITLVVSMPDAGEWDPTYGGATDVLKPRDIRKSYNYMNRYLEFDDVEVLRSYPYVRNQCVIFIKTFNSLHAVRPMTGRGSQAMRKTLTINIERRDGSSRAM